MGFALYPENNDCYVDRENNSFQSNIWGMEFLLAVMLKVEVLDESVCPKLKEDGDLVRDESLSNGKVPAYKFYSNDKWLVTPTECNIIAEGLLSFIDSNEKYSLKDHRGEHFVCQGDFNDQWVRSFAEFCKKMVDYGGFRVY